jgi:plastocyanin
VRVGYTVRWINRDGVTHTVTANDGAFDSGPKHRGGVFSHTFLEPGAYRYSCDLHLEMSGSVVVRGT